MQPSRRIGEGGPAVRYGLWLTAVLSLLMLAGCADGEGELAGETGDGAAAVEVGEGEGSAPRPAGADEDADGEGEGATGREGAQAGPVESVVAGDAGEVDVRVVDQQRLELVEVRETAGWSHTVEEADRTEIEVEFDHPDGRTVEVEIELESGELQVDVD